MSNAMGYVTKGRLWPLPLAAIVLVAGAAVVLSLWMGGLSTGSDGAQPAGRPASAGVDTILSRVDQADARLIVGVERQVQPLQGSESTVTVFDPSTGTILRTLPAGHSPWAMLRPSANQLLISQQYGPESGTTSGTLHIYDLTNLAASPKVLEMPGRTYGDIIYSPNWALSGNEQFLYYGERVNICPQGGDALPCDRWFVRVVDLEAGSEIARIETGSPFSCFPATSAGPRDIIGLCIGSGGTSMTRFTPDGGLEVLANFPGPVGGRGVPTYATLAWQRNDGVFYALYDDGSLVAASEEPSVDLLPGSGRIEPGFFMDEDTYVAPFHDGILVVELGAPEASQTIRTAQPFRVAAQLDAETLALVAADGQVRILNLLTLAESQPVGSLETVPDGLEGG